MLEIWLCIWNTSLASIMKVPCCSKIAEPVHVFALFFQREIKDWVKGLQCWERHLKSGQLTAAFHNYVQTLSCSLGDRQYLFQTLSFMWCSRPMHCVGIARSPENLWLCEVVVFKAQHLENDGIQRNLHPLRREKQTSFLAGIDPAGSLFTPQLLATFKFWRAPVPPFGIPVSNCVYQNNC